MLENIILGDTEIINALTRVFPDVPLNDFFGITHWHIMTLIDNTDGYCVFWSSYNLEHCKNTAFNGGY